MEELLQVKNLMYVLFVTKKFAQKQHMKIHEKIHKDEIPYSCQNCDKTFTQNAHMKLNERTHSCEKPYVCFFVTKRLLKIMK